MKLNEAKQLKPGDLVMDRGPFGGVSEVLRVDVLGPRKVQVFLKNGNLAFIDSIHAPTEAELAAHEARKAREAAHTVVRDEMQRVGNALGGACYQLGTERLLGPESDYSITLRRKQALALFGLLEELRAIKESLPTWRNHSSDGVYLWLTTRKGHFRGSVEERHGWYMASVAPAREGGLVPHRFAELADAKRFVERHHGLPECEVVE